MLPIYLTSPSRFFLPSSTACTFCCGRPAQGKLEDGQMVAVKEFCNPAGIASSSATQAGRVAALFQTEVEIMRQVGARKRTEPLSPAVLVGAPSSADPVRPLLGPVLLFLPFFFLSRHSAEPPQRAAAAGLPPARQRRQPAALHHHAARNRRLPSGECKWACDGC